MTKDWLILALLTLMMWGFWGFFPKIATAYINPKSALIYEVLGTIIVGVIILLVTEFKVETHPKGILFAILTGIAATLGTFFFFYAVTKGTASVTVTITALYPLITIILSYIILKETITITQTMGMIFAIIAMVLFTL